MSVTGSPRPRNRTRSLPGHGEAIAGSPGAPPFSGAATIERL
jgi:hypothetical protein